MNVLYDPFPQTVSIDGREYRIVTDFREWIRLHSLVRDDTVPTEYKIRLLMQWYIDPPADIGKGIKALGDFLRAEEATGVSLPDKEKTDAATPDKGASAGDHDTENIPAFSYEEDAACIFCAFMECYGIDLESVRYMHWWKFRILFEGLNEETEIKQRIRYRLMDLSTIKDKEERKRIKKIKRAIALKTEQKPVDDFEIGDVFS